MFQSSLGVPPDQRSQRTFLPRAPLRPPVAASPTQEVIRHPRINSVVVAGVTFGGRVWQVIDLMADGLTNKEIAARLGLQYDSVKAMIGLAYAKTRVVHPELIHAEMSTIFIRWAIMRRLGIPLEVWRDLDHPDTATFTFQTSDLPAPPPNDGTPITALLKETTKDA